MKKININLCFSEAWRGFKGWWLPLCLVSSVIVLTQVSIPKKIISKDFDVIKPYYQAYIDFKTGVFDSPTHFFKLYWNFIQECSDINSDPKAVLALLIVIIKITAFVSVIVCILNILMIILAKASVEPDKKKRTVKRDLSRGFILSLSYILLSFIKVIPFVFCIVPGIYVYCKLYFTGFIITEESAEPFAAMKKSWKMTEGNFFEVLIIFLVTLAVNLISIISIIGLIPGTSYNYTLRAAAYKQVRDKADLF